MLASKSGLQEVNPPEQQSPCTRVQKAEIWTNRSAAIDLIEAHRVTHILNGVLLDLSAAAFRLALEDELLGVEAEIWTASLRSDIDGIGGAYALIAPASLVWGMPPRQPLGVSLPTDIYRAARQLSEALTNVTQAGVPIAIRSNRRRIVLVSAFDAIVKSEKVIGLAKGYDKSAPVALRIS